MVPATPALDSRDRLDEVARLQRRWSVVREINKQILHATSERELFTDACRIAVELGLFRFAWIGLISADGEHVEPAARWGHEAAYLDGIRIDVAATPHGQGPTGTAVREGRPWISNDIAVDPRFEPWRAAALERGYRCCTAFPMRRGGRVVGAINIYGDQPDLFDDEQVGLLLGLADDLSYAMDLLDREERRSRSEERYRAVFEQAFEGIFLFAASHEIVDANESACAMLGYTRAEILALRAEDVVHPEDLAAAPIRFGTIAPGGVILSERRFIRKDRSVMHGELSTKHLLDAAFQVVVRDVTERKAVQAQLLLADRMSSLGRLASGVAHEVNNPLAYVMLNLELLATRLGRLAPEADAPLLEQMRRAVDDAREGAERVRRIVRTLSTFGRGEEERVGPVDVHAVLDSAIDIASMQLRHGARLTREYEGAVAVSANAFRLGQVFVNLLVNAGDALPEGAPSNEIRLRTRVRPDDWVVVEVQDNGVGIPRHLQPRIFDPFFTTKPIGQGTGLGLAVCHAIVTSFGGELTCESVPGQGATFRVALKPALATQSREEVPSSPRAAVVRGRVLVVDDDARVADAIASALAEGAGHEVTVVWSGKAALDLCRTKTFDCILCDVMMPDLSGVDVYEALRRDGRAMDRRVVFMTGGAVTASARAALARVPNRVLEKPLDSHLLRSAVATVVEEAAA
jgi:two-component system cell cycle sensor histidine kinase/response regulator CckA